MVLQEVVSQIRPSPSCVFLYILEPRVALSAVSHVCKHNCYNLISVPLCLSGSAILADLNCQYFLLQRILCLRTFVKLEITQGTESTEGLGQKGDNTRQAQNITVLWSFILYFNYKLNHVPSAVSWNSPMCLFSVVNESKTNAIPLPLFSATRTLGSQSKWFYESALNAIWIIAVPLLHAGEGLCKSEWCATGTVTLWKSKDKPWAEKCQTSRTERARQHWEALQCCGPFADNNLGQRRMKDCQLHQWRQTSASSVS